MVPLALCFVLLVVLVGCGANEQQSPADAVAIDQFERAGGDVTAPRLISYFLIFPSDGAARRSRNDLRAHGFKIDAEYTAEFADDRDGWLVVEKVGALADLAETEALLSELAARRGGQYDGWEAAP